MITIIHGDDVVASRKFFQEEKQKSKNPMTLYGDNLKLVDLVEAIEGQRLFSDEKNIFVEEFFSKTKDTKTIMSYVKANAKLANIYLWEAKELTKNILLSFFNPDVKLFKIPQSVFAFLDSIKPGNGKNILPLFHNALANNETELVFYLIIRQFRLFIAFKDQKSKNNIEEVNRLQPWQKSKLQKQASLFTAEQLIQIYNKLFNIDYSVKTGALPFPITAAVDFFLLDL